MTSYDFTTPDKACQSGQLKTRSNYSQRPSQLCPVITLSLTHTFVCGDPFLPPQGQHKARPWWEMSNMTHQWVEEAVRSLSHLCCFLFTSWSCTDKPTFLPFFLKMFNDCFGLQCNRLLAKTASRLAVNIVGTGTAFLCRLKPHSHWTCATWHHTGSTGVCS